MTSYTEAAGPVASAGAQVDAMGLVDLRSDTVTRPCKAMRKAMQSASVGDDDYGEDPTVSRLESQLAKLLGKSAAVFFPTGTQSNLAAILTHCGRGDELIGGRRFHALASEAGGASALGGIVMCPIDSEPCGGLRPEKIEAAIKIDDPHYPRTRLLCLENTTGGKAVPVGTMRAASEVARQNGMSVHLDGARIFNAAFALNVAPAVIAAVADSVSVCMSKGLGAPAGTLLAGDTEFCAKARRQRKMLGGNMRQSGILAAAGIYALNHNLKTLPRDHARAARLAGSLSDLVGTGLRSVECRTNMVFVEPEPEERVDLRQFLAARGILVGGQSPAMRLVAHRDVDDRSIQEASRAFHDFFLQESRSP